jgi:hypothetical protein
MRRQKMKPAEAARIREEWLGAVDALGKQVRGWAEQQGWSVDQSEEEVTEEELGTYRVPIWQIHTPRGTALLRPVGREILGARGRVDLSAWPTLYRVMLLQKPDQNWVIRTESGLNWPHPWKQETFVEVTEGLLGAE